MKILVTGACGYIGSHFVKRALHRYPTVKITAIDNLTEGHIESIPDKSKVNYFNVDLQDFEETRKILATERPDAVVHFAANAYVGESQENPFKYFDNNVIGSLNLFKAMDRANVKKLIFSSSCTTYGKPEFVPLNENHSQHPISVYGATKVMVEEALRALNKSSNWSFIALRYFNASGADDDAEIGESHDPETHLIPLVLQTALGKREQLSIFGDDYETADGTCIRDYVHVNDLADAHCLALDKILKNGPMAEGINLGTSKGASVKEIIDMCEEITGMKVKHKIVDRRPGDPPKLVADFKKAKDVLGWNPEYDLRKIIETAWKWEKSRTF